MPCMPLLPSGQVRSSLTAELLDAAVGKEQTTLDERLYL